MEQGLGHSTKAPIFAIDRLRMGTDGKGITTLVCFMGCPLRCAYCLNDQCHEDIYEPDGETQRKGVMLLSPKELYDRVKIDNIYFQATGGGICFCGGEPMMYHDFIEEFCQLVGKRWKITIETSLYGASYNDIEQLSNHVDQWIVDIKDLNSDIYERYTGAKHAPILQSLACLRRLGLTSKTRVKVPLIPSYNQPKDLDESICDLREHGFQNIEIVQYVKRPSKYHLKKKLP